jgi:hypothetical protein
MQGDTELLLNFNFFFNSNSGNVAERNSKSMQFLFFLKIVKIEPANKVQIFL